MVTQINKAVQISLMGDGTPGSDWLIPAIGFDSAAQLWRPYKISFQQIADMQLVPGYPEMMFSPSGRMSLSSGATIQTTNIINANTVWMVLGNTDTTSIFNGGMFVLRHILANRPVVLNPVYHLPGAVHDIWEYYNPLTALVEYGYGPAWTVGGGSAFGPGIGAGSAERDYSWRGRTTNKNSLVVRNYGVPTTVPAFQANFCGSVGIGAIAGTTSVTEKLKLVSNYFNPVQSNISFKETEAITWTSPTDGFRQIRNGASGDEIEIVQCGGGLFADLDVIGSVASTSGALGHAARMGVGIGSTTTSLETSFDNSTIPMNTGFQAIAIHARYRGPLPMGRYKLYPLENSFGDTTTIFYGYGGSGIDGWIQN